MSKTWYPVVDYDKCSGCQVCVNFCRNGVYEKKEGKPSVIYPEGCVHGCRGCQVKCPSGALQYAGDTDKGKIISSCCG